MLMSIVLLTIFEHNGYHQSSSLKFQRRNERKMKRNNLHFNEFWVESLEVSKANVEKIFSQKLRMIKFLTSISHHLRLSL